MALKNLIREQTFRNGRTTWELRTRAGELVEPFSLFCNHISDLSERTQKRYVEALSRFIDYLYEVGVFSAGGVSAKRLNAAVEAYTLLLRDGSTGLVSRIDARGSQLEDAWLVDVSNALKWDRLSPASFPNTLAPINQFLELSETLARQELERAKILGISADEPARLIRALDGHTELSTREVARMRQNSMFGSVAKYAPRGIRKPRRLALPGEKPQTDRKDFDFPRAFLLSVVASSMSWRDKALWLLLAASGIRSSEAKNLLLCDIDFEQQRVYVVGLPPVSRTHPMT